MGRMRLLQAPSAVVLHPGSSLAPWTTVLLEPVRCEIFAIQPNGSSLLSDVQRSLSVVPGSVFSGLASDLVTTVPVISLGRSGQQPLGGKSQGGCE